MALSKLLIVLVCLLVQVYCDNSPVIESPAGKFIGRVIKSRNGRDIYTFEGVPFAKPPVGELRFKDPVKMPKLEGIFEAKESSNQCFQPPFDFAQLKNLSAFTGEEDCLYLNVYVPKVDKDVGLLPVLVWIHGGGFFLGSGSTKMNGPDYLLDKDMILVATNYRLGILGFLSSGDEVIPGNFAMKDQIMALKWVQENIASFGGDPNAVTIAGESAGGASVSLLMHSPLSKGLFHRVIAQSGTAYSAYAIKPWAVAKKEAEKVASFLGCSFKSHQLLKCLQKMPKEELFEAGHTLLPDDVCIVNHVPVIEEHNSKAFLTKDSWQEPANIPLMVGVTSREAMYFIAEMTAKHPKFKDGLSAVRKEINYMLPFWGYYMWLPNKDKITDELIKFYAGSTAEATEEQITNLFSDLMVNYGTHLSGKREKGPTYMYKLSYQGNKNIPMEPPKGLEDGVSHGEDLIYLFNTSWFPSKEWTKEDIDMSHKMVDMWYSFTRYGNPTPDSKIWKESDGGAKYLDITNQGLIMKSDMFQQRMQFLDELNIDRTVFNLHDEL